MANLKLEIEEDMQPEFWLQRWQQNKTGFHLNEVNPKLIEYWPQLGVPKGARVFVPMCGKSLDMCWLLEQGYTVVGVEISPQAIEAFFTEQGISYQHTQQGPWSVYRSAQIELWCGDYFALSRSELGQIDAVYDRAALIAMPENLRAVYAAKLVELSDGAVQLLITLEYPQAQMSGPPFSVVQEEVTALYQNVYVTDSILSKKSDVLADHAHFAERGLTSLFECVYLLQVSKK